MERVRRLMFVTGGAVIGGLIGGYPLAWVLVRLVPFSQGPHGSGGFGAALGVLFNTGFHLGLLLGIGATLGVCGGVWSGWLLALRTDRPMPRRAGV